MLGSVECRKTIKFGKIDYLGHGRKNCPVEVEIELRKRGGEETFRFVNGQREYTGEKTPEYYELAICGDIWNHVHTDIYCGGQCLDTIAEYVHSDLFKEIYELWKRYHLNGMRAGTPEQEEEKIKWLADGHRYDYTEICEHLKEVGLYEVMFTGKTSSRTYNNEPYRYGSGWVVEDLPEEVIARVKEICEKEN